MQRIIAVLAVAFGCIILFFFVGGRPSGTPRASDDRMTAWLGCKTVLERSLKAPDTAKWASFNDARIVKMDNGHYAVGSEVTAQNSFGVPLRQEWTCEVAVNGNNYTVYLLALDDQVIVER